MAIAGAEANVALGAAHGDAAVTGVNIDVARNLVGPDRTVTGMNLDATADAFGGHRAVAGIDLEVCILRHGDFDLQPAIVAAPGEAPVALHAGVDRDAVAILVRVDVQVFVELIAVVGDAKFDLF